MVDIPVTFKQHILANQYQGLPVSCIDFDDIYNWFEQARP